MTTSKEPTAGNVETPIKPRPITWPGLLAATTVLVGAATVILHFLGLVVHRTYLTEWSISSTPFQKSTDWLLLNGYYGVWNGLAMLFVAMLKNFLWVVIGVTLLLTYLWLLFGTWNPLEKVLKNRSWLQLYPAWLKKVGLWISAGILMTVMLISLTLALFFLIGAPAQIGRTVGKEIYASHFKDFAKGCEASSASCLQILKNGESIGTGYLLDSSAIHFAYYDTQLKRSRVIPIDGLEIRALRPPAEP